MVTMKAGSPKVLLCFAAGLRTVWLASCHYPSELD